MLVFSYLWILNESARWLLSKGRNEEAIVILKKAAIMNDVELSSELLSPLYELEKTGAEDKDKELEANHKVEKETSNFKKVIRSSIIRKRLFVCSFMWITCTFVYYGLSINSVSLAGNKYVNFMLVGFVEIPANFMCLLVLDRFGRKKTLITWYVLSAFLCISLSFVPKGEFFKTSLSNFLGTTKEFRNYFSTFSYQTHFKSLIMIMNKTFAVGKSSCRM